MIFFIRLITSACLFAFLGKANIWLNPLSNLLLAIGYRFFLMFSPLFTKISGKYAIALALLLSFIGTLLFCFDHHHVLAMGAVLVGMGFSVSGYLIKSRASETASGAAYNKIAINAGSLLSGLILLLSISSKNIFFMVAAASLLCLSVLAFVDAKRNKTFALPLPKNTDKKRACAWFLIGVVIGIKFFGVLSVLPQYILSHAKTLPAWYGAILFVNSAMIIFLQMPIMRWMTRMHQHYNAFNITLGVMMLGLLIIAFPRAFYADTLAGAMTWTFLLSIVECFASYLDVAASQSGCLFVKEIAVGFGAGLTVFFSRYFSVNDSSILIALSGIVAIILAALLLYKADPATSRHRPLSG